MAYDMHEYMTAPAKPRCEVWRTALGLMLAGVIYMGLIFAVFAGLTPLLGVQFLMEMQNGATPVAMLMLLATFFFMTAGAWLAARWLHKRSFASLLGPRHLLIPDFWRSMAVLVILTAVLSLLPLGDDLGEMVQQISYGQWALLFLPALVLIFIQISAEEILFRGYLQSQLAARFSSPLVWMIIPSVLFGLLHHAPSVNGANAPYITVWAIIFGLFAADLTARAGNLGPALALHLVNNVAALLFVGIAGNLSGLALFTLSISPDDPALKPLIWVDLAAMTVSWLAVRLAIRR